MQQRFAIASEFGVDAVAGDRAKILAKHDLVGHFDVVSVEFGGDVSRRRLSYDAPLAVVALQLAEVRTIAPPTTVDGMKDLSDAPGMWWWIDGVARLGAIESLAKEGASDRVRRLLVDETADDDNSVYALGDTRG
jgi:hypothetical protein